jgi:hypothetical protein
VDEEDVSVEFGFMAISDTKRDSLAFRTASTHSLRSFSFSIDANNKQKNELDYIESST